MKEVTLGDIARIAECSTNTVSLALRDSPRISDQRRKEIESIALSLGYVPHLSARHLSGKKSGFIGVYTQALEDAVRVTLTNKLITGFRGTGLHPILGLGDSPDQTWEDSSWIQAFRAMRAEAIVLVGEVHNFNPPTAPHPVPLLLVHCQPSPDLTCDYIGLDRTEAAVLGRDQLFSSGRKHLVIFGEKSSHFSRGAVDLTTMESGSSDGYTAVIRHVPYVDLEEMSRLCFDYYMKHRGEYDSALFQDAGVAAGFITLADEAGISIPDELAIVAYDYYPQAHMLKISLSTIEQPLTRLSQRAIDMIIRRVHRPEAPLLQEVLPHTLARRDSS